MRVLAFIPESSAFQDARLVPAEGCENPHLSEDVEASQKNQLQGFLSGTHSNAGWSVGCATSIQTASVWSSRWNAPCRVLPWNSAWSIQNVWGLEFSLLTESRSHSSAITRQKETMKGISNLGRGGADERILLSAVGLFASFGYNSIPVIGPFLQKLSEYGGFGVNVFCNQRGADLRPHAAGRTEARSHQPAQYLYPSSLPHPPAAHSQADFVSSFRSIISSSLGDKGRQACDRAHSLFFYARHLPVPFWFPLDTSPGSADFAAVASGVKLAIGRLTDESSDFKH
jgi:hypothetical protein